MNGAPYHTLPLACAAGPLPVTDGGLIVPDRLDTLEQAQAAFAQLVSTAALRAARGQELTRRERMATRALRRHPGVRTPTAPHEFTAIAKNRLRQRSKAAKRARAAQRTLEGARQRYLAQAGGAADAE